ncbi:MAG: aspartate kinase [Alphaproteobacteria bacterium TMED87]|nr:MAG: aspartate kinase [Alphaproteobacteria bacterium TMED87]|tara:strand:- start:5113 stop:6351 length:1239 start_codon:yes stop_codon:yes gene_type:complete
MSLVVQKFGGTSVASTKHIQKVAEKIIQARQRGQNVVAVVSAMGDNTDRLDELAKEVNFNKVGAKREIDVLLSTGEQVTIAVLSMMLMKLGCPARSFTGGQAGIFTDKSHTRSRIREIKPDRLLESLELGEVPVVAGFQGIDCHGDITTFGRGGSDTTAVALAAVLEADECQIFTDVEGVYTTDPRVVDQARLMDRVTFEEMLELASLGSKVLHARAVEFASKYQVPLRVLSTFVQGEGTLITKEDKLNMEQPIISGIAFTKDEAKLTVLGVEDVPGIAWKILGPISDANIGIDMIVQNVAADNTTDFTFTVSRDDYHEAMDLLNQVAMDIGARQVNGDDKIAKLSIVGVGMRSHAGVASKMFQVLADRSINIQMISTSEIKVSVVIAEEYIELAARALHSVFNLEEKSIKS